ncbi:hypothetical protein M2151_001165 [Lachnospiraceae bacterium PH1-22]
MKRMKEVVKRMVNTGELCLITFQNDRSVIASIEEMNDTKMGCMVSLVDIDRIESGLCPLGYIKKLEKKRKSKGD